ncbi:hypothetical protein AMS68_006273 [Peltaster fructicola]|uniref:RRM domain-containing protein n=1 Tax=Peltaster fructicola TaxID=286661 RepID=A0A6H0Y1D5_9PEZI|nr:hypothetical protein AMS68_006273 [Peltaster fructicola]
MPWEFPQNASRKQEEDFLDTWFGKEEVHMQGGRTHEGSGYRFLKQCWYVAAIWNLEGRVPGIAKEWWTREENQELINDFDTLAWLCRSDTKPESSFTPKDFEVYGHKILYWAMRRIQQWAWDRRQQMFPYGYDHTKQASGRQTNVKAADGTSIETSIAADGDKPSTTSSNIATANQSSISTIDADTADKPQVDARNTRVAHRPTIETDAGISSSASSLAIEKSTGSSASVSAELPPAVLDKQQLTLDKWLVTSPVKSVTTDQPSAGRQDSVTVTSPDAEVQSMNGEKSSSPDIAIASSQEHLQLSSREHLKSPPVSSAAALSTITPTEESSKPPMPELLSSELTAQMETVSDEMAQGRPVLANEPTLMQSSGAKIAAPVPQNGTSNPTAALQDPYSSTQQTTHSYHRGSQTSHDHSPMEHGMSAGSQRGHTDYSSQRGGRGYRRGSRGDSGRRLSRGGRDNSVRSRLGLNSFNNAGPAMEYYQQVFQPPLQFQGPQLQGPPNLQLYGALPGHGQYQHPGPLPWEPFQHQASQPYGYLEHGGAPQLQFPQHTHGPPMVAQSGEPFPPSALVSHELPSAGPSDSRCNEVTPHHIGSNRTEVRMLVLFQLPEHLTSEDVVQMFASIGLLGVVVNMLPQTNAHRTSVMAFARFPTHDQARRGLTLNGHVVGQNHLRVEVSKEFWDTSSPQYRARYPAVSQVLAHQPVPAHVERSWTPCTKPYERLNEGRDPMTSHELPGQRGLDPQDKQPDRRPSHGSQKARVLATQDARFMDVAPASSRARADTTPATTRRTSPKRHKKKKHAASQAVETNSTQIVRDKTNQGNELARHSSASTRSNDTDSTARPSKSSAQHKYDDTKATLDDESTRVTGKRASSPGLCPAPSARAEQPLKIIKRDSKAFEEPLALAETSPSQTNKQTDTLEVHEADKEVLQQKLVAGPRERVKSYAQSAAAAHVSDGDYMRSSSMQTSGGTLTVNTKQSHPTTSVPLVKTTNESAPSKMAQVPRVVTPMRVARSKASLADSSAPTPTSAVSKKAAAVVSSGQRMSETVQETPIISCTTTPATPKEAESNSSEQQVEPAKENPQGKAREKAEEGQSQTKKKGKGTLKEKPKELAKLAADTETLKAATEEMQTVEVKTEDNKQTNMQAGKNSKTEAVHQDKGAALSSTTATKKQSKGKQKAEKASAPVTGNPEHDQTVESVDTNVTSPSKRTLASIGSFFGFGPRQGSSTTSQKSQHSEAGNMPAPSKAAEAKQTESTNTAAEQQACVSSKIAKDAKPDSSAFSGRAFAPVLKLDLTIGAALPQSLESKPSQAAGLGLLGLSALESETAKVEQVETSSPGQLSFERDKGRDTHYDTSETVSARSTPSRPSPDPPARLQRSEPHLIEAPKPRNSRKRRIPRPQSASGSDGFTTLSSDAIIAAHPAHSPDMATSGDYEGTCKHKPITLYTMSQDPYLPASERACYILWPSVREPVTSDAQQEVSTGSGDTSHTPTMHDPAEEAKSTAPPVSSPQHSTTKIAASTPHAQDPASRRLPSDDSDGTTVFTPESKDVSPTLSRSSSINLFVSADDHADGLGLTLETPRLRIAKKDNDSDDDDNNHDLDELGPLSD